MVKKLAVLAGAGALLLSVAVPALACQGGWCWFGGNKDTAIVSNSASAVANTGNNNQGNYVGADDDVTGDVNVSGNNTMYTGNANAYAGALVVANTHIGCRTCGRGGSRQTDFAMVSNSAGVSANTGYNGQGNTVSAGDDIGSWCGSRETRVSGNNYLNTGNAKSTARAWEVVNTHWTH